MKRLVYASSVAAYGFHPENPQPLTEEVPAARQRELLLLGPEGRAGGDCWTSCSAGSEVEAYVFRPCIVAGPRATMLIEQMVDGARLGDPLPALRRGLGRLPLPRPVLPDVGVPIQLVHHDDVAAALAAAIAGEGEPGAYNLAGEGEVGDRRHRPRARLALGPGARARGRPRRRPSPGASASSRRSWSGRRRCARRC